MLGIPNAIIYVPITASPLPIGFDEYTGEPIFFNAPTSPTAIQATLEESTPPRDLSLPGVDTTLCYLEGRLVNANKANLIIPKHFYDIQITMHSGNYSARFYAMPAPQSRLGLQSVFGSALQGWLVV